MRIVHAADLHLDSPMVGLERYEGAPVAALRGASRRALENLVRLCLEEGAKLLLLAGDLFDGDWRDYAIGLFLNSQLRRLDDAGVKVALVRGNHDAQSQVTRSLRWPKNVVELGTKEPMTHVFEDLGVAVHGQGFATRAVTEDLARRYPAPLAGLFNIGLLHTCLDGREGHERYAPTRLQTLVDRGYDYWALGHVHAREELARDPWVVFPGNLQGRHLRECGPKGATLVTVRGGRVATAEHRPLDVARFASLDVDVGPAASAADALDLARAPLDQALAEASGRVLALRVRLTGCSSAHGELGREPERWLQELRQVAAEQGGDGIWIADFQVRTAAPGAAPPDAQALDDPLSEVLRAIARLRDDPEALEALLPELASLRAALPPDLRRAGGLGLDEPELVRAALVEVERRFLPRLLERGPLP